MPLGPQVVAHLRRGEGGRRVQPQAGPAAHPHFALATGQLARKFPALVQLVHAFEGEDLRLLVVLGPTQLAQRGQVVQIGIASEDAPPLVVPGPVGEAHVALDELRAGQRIELVVGVRIVQSRGDAPALVDLVGQAVGADPLLALLGAAILAPLQLALPVRVGRSAATGYADRTAVDVAASRVGQLAVGQGEAHVPALRRIEVHAEGMGQA